MKHAILMDDDMTKEKSDLKVIRSNAIQIGRDPDQNCIIADVRGMPPQGRHEAIFKLFGELGPGEKMLVINDHEPVHLVQFLKHERKDFDESSYRAYRRGEREWIGELRKIGEGESPSTATHLFTSFEKERSYNETSFSPVPVYGDGNYRVILTYIRAGQFIPVHRPECDLVFLVHKGRGTAVAGGETREIGPGDILIAKKGVERGIRALTDMEALHLVTPPPGEKDHEDVVKRIELGEFQ